MEEMISKAYIARCRKTLKQWGAPLEDWYCIGVIDLGDDDEEMAPEDFATCELCGCNKVRYVHVMRHENFFEDVEVGCICAGIMEGDILAAKEREKEMRNRSKRRLNFPRRKWREARNGNLYLNYRGDRVFINNNRDGSYFVNCNGINVWRYKGRPIDNFLSAAYAAFDLVDPIERYRS